MKREPELTFLRLVPGSSFMHRLWAGTKLLVAFELAVVASLEPTWIVLGIVGALVVLGLVAGRIPLGAFPRLPGWFYGVVLFSAVTSLYSDVAPVVYLGPVPLSIGALGEWARLTGLTVVLLASGALVGWTTPLGEVAPALSTLGRPLRWFRLPVDEWVIAIALAIRCLPLLIDEIRSLAAARRLRRQNEDAETMRRRGSAKGVILEAHDLMATAVVTSIRRARDLSDALVARGGLGGAVSANHARFRFADGFVLVFATAVCVGALLVVRI